VHSFPEDLSMSCVVSSRTWGGGEPRRCPICDALSWVEPSVPVGDAPCPACGHLLWPAHRTRLPITAGFRQHAGAAFRLGRTVGRIVRRVRGAVAAIKPSASKRKSAPLVPSTGGLWDAWLDT
jgi:hypothetical protein